MHQTDKCNSDKHFISFNLMYTALYPGTGSSLSMKDRKWMYGKDGQQSWWQRMCQKWSKFHSNGQKESSDHIFDAETMSISNAKKNAIKRNSL